MRRLRSRCPADETDSPPSGHATAWLGEHRELTIAHQAGDSFDELMRVHTEALSVLRFTGHFAGGKNGSVASGT